VSGKPLVWISIGLVIGVALLSLSSLFSTPRYRLPPEIAYSKFLSDADSKAIREVTFDGNQIRGTYVDGRLFATYLPPLEKPVERLLASGVTVSARPTQAQPDDPAVIGAFINWLPFFAYIGVMWLFIARPLWHIERRLQALEAALSKTPPES